MCDDKEPASGSAAEPEKPPSIRAANARGIRRAAQKRKGIVAALVGVILMGLFFVFPLADSPMSEIGQVAVMAVAVVAAFGLLGRGRFAVTVGRRKEPARFSGSAGAVMLWLWCFLVLFGAVLSWRGVDLASDWIATANADENVVVFKRQSSFTLSARAPVDP